MKNQINCCYCGKFIPYLRQATRIGHKVKQPIFHYSYEGHNPLSGSNPDIICHNCFTKEKKEVIK